MVVAAAVAAACHGGTAASEPAPASSRPPAAATGSAPAPSSSASAPASAYTPVAAIPGAVEGTLLGKPFDVRSAVSGTVWGTGGGVALVILSDRDESCDLRATKKQRPGATRIHLLLSYKSEGATSPPEHKGSFGIGDHKQVDFSDAFVVWHDQGCREVRRVEATSGEVKLLRYPRPERPQEYAGEFTLVVGKDRIKGSFTAPLCGAVSRGADKPPDVEPPACE